MNCPICEKKLDQSKNNDLFGCKKGCQFSFAKEGRTNWKTWVVWSWTNPRNEILAQDLSSIEECFRILKMRAWK